MKKVKMIARSLVLILWASIMSCLIGEYADAEEYRIIQSYDSMDIKEYREIKENTLTNKFNSRMSLFGDSVSKNQIIGVIKSGLINLQESINLDDYIKNLKKSDKDVPMLYFFDTLNEYPEIFYPDLTVQCTFSYNESTNEIVSYNLEVSYKYDNNTINNMKNKFNENINYLKNNYLSTAKSDLEKEYMIHDYIVKNCRYDYENIENLPTIDHTSYGSLVNGVAVCDGYSKGAKVLLDLCGIESGIIESEKMNHAWNYIKINGKYYNLDVTWDDRDDEYIDYSYFNISNYDISSGSDPHIWNSSNYPDCISVDFNFLREGNYYIRYLDKLYTTDYFEGEEQIYTRNLDGSNYKVKFLEDVNDDDKVDSLDIALVAKHYNSMSTDHDFDEVYDINDDGIVDIYDIVKVCYRANI